MRKIKNICILGAGGWGTALAFVLSMKSYDTVLWSHDENTVNEINYSHTNSTYLPNVILPENIKASTSLDIIQNADLLVNAIPTQYIQSVLEKFSFSFEDKILVNGSKGIEIDSLLRISEIFNKYSNLSLDNFSVLTGPSHAEEVARLMPTTVVVASKNEELAIMIRDIFTTERFRVYTSYDVVGCELGGSLKNIIAIAAGIIDGLQLGDNTKAALLTRGLEEIRRLGLAMGAEPITFSGLSGLGDLFVTCNSKHSRNRYVGEQIGKGKTLDIILDEMKMIAEGIWTTKAAYTLSQKYDVEMPISEQMYKILFTHLKPMDAINELFKRGAKDEFWW